MSIVSQLKTKKKRKKGQERIKWPVLVHLNQASSATEAGTQWFQIKKYSVSVFFQAYSQIVLSQWTIFQIENGPLSKKLRTAASDKFTKSSISILFFS